MKHTDDEIIDKAKNGIGNLSIDQIRELNTVRIPVQIDLEQYIVVFNKITKDHRPQWSPERVIR